MAESVARPRGRSKLFPRSRRPEYGSRVRPFALAGLVLLAACEGPRPLTPGEGRIVAGARVLDVPRTAGAPSTPVIIGLHGLGDSPENFARLFSELTPAAEIDVIEGFEVSGDGHAWFSWPPGTSDDQVASAIDAAERRLWPVIAELAHGRRVIIVGFSQGAMLTYALAARHPDAIARGIAMAGRLPESLWPKRPGAPIDAIHGTVDTVIEIDAGRAAIDAFRAAGGRAEMHEFPGVGHSLNREMRDVLYALVTATL
jgi:phospholipase/carboxylesterase